MTSLIVRVDCENNAESFWDAVNALLDKDMLGDDYGVQYALAVLRSENEVEITDAETMERFTNLVASLPGWDDGPEYAEHPLLFDAV